MSFDIALSGLRAASRSLDEISHNVANVTTEGFRKSSMESLVTNSVAGRQATGEAVAPDTPPSTSHDFSDVNLTEQLVALIEAQRNFQANAQVIATTDTINRTLLTMRR